MRLQNSAMAPASNLNIITPHRFSLRPVAGRPRYLPACVALAEKRTTTLVLPLNPPGHTLRIDLVDGAPVVSGA